MAITVTPGVNNYNAQFYANQALIWLKQRKGMAPRINRKYEGERVRCKFCNGQFVLDTNSPKVKINAFYTSCPHCSDELRAAMKYVGTKAACKHCGGKLHIVDGNAS